MDALYSIPSSYHAPGARPERLLTISDAAETLGAHKWQVQRAVKRGDIPSYSPFNSRKLVKLSEVVAYIDSCRQGGSDER